MVANNITSMIRVSISSTGRPGGSSSNFPDISGDGRFITFTSSSITLDPTGGSNGDFQHVFLRDTLTGTTTLVTMGFNGTPVYSGGGQSSVSDDGRFVTFIGDPDGFVVGETPSAVDNIYVRDMMSGTTISLPSQSTTGNSPADAQISGDGRYVVFWQSGDGVGYNMYRYDLLTRQTENASLPITGVAANGNSLFGSISHDGRYIVFYSEATNLLDLGGSDDNGVGDVFLRDMATGALSRVSLTDNELQTNAYSTDPVVSDNGRYVVFTSSASNLIAGPSSGHTQIFIRDTVAGTTRIVSAPTGAIQGDGDSSNADISADGRYVVFESTSANLVAGDVNGLKDVFLRDMVTGSMVMLSMGALGGVSNGASNDVHISADGLYATFVSSASNLTPGDSNNTADVFRVSLSATNAADLLFGGDGADAIFGLGGDDIINGGLGADSMTGGTGSDTYYVDNAGDQVFESVGGGFDKVMSYVNYVLTASAAVEFLMTNASAGTTPISLTGNDFAQTIVGNNGVSNLKGMGGDDALFGNGGSDNLWGGLGADLHVGGDDAGTIDLARYDDANYGNLTIRLDAPNLNTGAAAGDTYNGIEGLVGGVGNDTIFGNGNLIIANYLYGMGGNDFIYGLGGPDVLNGGDGSDNLWGGLGADIHIGGNDAGIDLARYDDANYGNLTIRLDAPALNTGAAAGDTYNGIEGLVGGVGNDTVVGDGLANYLYGGGGSDSIYGQLGNDFLNGGAGADRFIFNLTPNAATNADRITDFQHGVDDIWLFKSVFSAIGATLDASEFRAGTAAVDPDDYIIYNAATGQLFYDATGSNAGAAVLFATVTPNTILDINDFVMA